MCSLECDSNSSKEAASGKGGGFLLLTKQIPAEGEVYYEDASSVKEA